MTYDLTLSNLYEKAAYIKLFDALAGHNLLLQANAPQFTILAATPQRLQDVGMTKEDVIGKLLFEAHPGNPTDPSDNGVINLRSSLDHVLRYKEIHELPIQRYDLPNEHGGFSEKYWRASNRPVFNDEGEVAYIIHTAEDITSQIKAAQREVQMEGVEKVFSLFMHSPIVVGLLNGDDYVLELANEAAFKFWGKRPEEIIGEPILQVLPELLGQGIIELFDLVRTSGKPYTAHEVPVMSLANGKREQHYFNLIYQPYYGQNNAVVTGIFTISHDVTEQVLAKRKIEENEAELQKRVTERTAALEQQKIFISSILEATFDGIYALKAARNAEGQIVDFEYLFANNNIAKVLHLDVKKIIGSSMLELIPENRSNGFFDLFCQLIQTGETVHGETHFVTSDIDNWYEYVVVPIDSETVVVSTKDITEKKSAALQIEEQRNLLNSILKNSSNGISVSKVLRAENGEVIDAITILANEAAIKNIGLPKDIYLSKRATEIEPNILGTPYYQACIRTLDTGEPFMMQYQMETTKRWLELTVSKLDEDHLIHVFTDVTAIKEAQLQLERTVEDLKLSNQNLEEFAYAASHDLKEPMRKIQLFSDRLKASLQQNLSSNDSDMFDRIIKATNRMNTLIDDLLMFSHVSRGAVLEETIDLNQKISRVLEDLEVEIHEQKAIVTVERLPTIKGHRRQLQQLFQNLIGNAIKYHKHEVNPEVHISCRKITADEAIPITTATSIEDYYLLEISDNGIGFEPEEADRIFNIFTRLHGNAEYKGTGVGLSIAKKVVENHGGYIWAQSEPGKGSIFSVLLPFKNH
jgi:signal transduction histidine kinase